MRKFELSISELTARGWTIERAAPYVFLSVCAAEPDQPQSVLNHCVCTPLRTDKTQRHRARAP